MDRNEKGYTTKIKNGLETYWHARIIAGRRRTYATHYSKRKEVESKKIPILYFFILIKSILFTRSERIHP